MDNGNEDNGEDQSVGQYNKAMPDQGVGGPTIIKGRPNINEITKRNEEEEKRRKQSTYVTAGIIILLLIGVIFLVYFFS